MNRGQSFLLLLIGSVALLTLFVIRPFIEYVIASAILAYVLFPFHVRLSRGASRGTLQPIPRVACASVGVHAVRALLVVVVDRRRHPAARVHLLGVRPRPHGDRPGNSDIDVEAIETELAALTGEQIEVGEVLTTVGQVLANTLFGGLGGIVTTALRASVGLSLALFLVYYTLLDGPAFVRWLRQTSRFRRMSRPTSSIGSTR